VVGAWLAAFAITVGLYFHDLKNEADPEFALGQDKTETLGAALQHFAQDPLHSLAFMARVLGGHCPRHQFGFDGRCTVGRPALVRALPWCIGLGSPAVSR